MKGKSPIGSITLAVLRLTELWCVTLYEPKWPPPWSYTVYKPAEGSNSIPLCEEVNNYFVFVFLINRGTFKFAGGRVKFDSYLHKTYNRILNLRNNTRVLVVVIASTPCGWFEMEFPDGMGSIYQPWKLGRVASSIPSYAGIPLPHSVKGRRWGIIR